MAGEKRGFSPCKQALSEMSARRCAFIHSPQLIYEQTP
ncbi:hypothetical protein P262_02031 [Cronobacter malonaticus]|uniref:Uncharacterized protein n=1 Tax=Cronobacter malonaticus TaxID=413503 RepID=V5TZ13_9ENTR|nr:hypothetical protein P262_02031 [Cronobacter malonaticus]CCJ93264.1 hypothetical protein BN131_937 [Cronobacter malonaticus 681]CCJ98831.1 hypothetical protein BN130_1423 [Cronobacter malonaticus 507]